MPSVCLSGGGVKGIAHLGVLDALNEEGISFEAFSGTSFGALIACALNKGISSDEIIKMTTEFSIYNLSGIAWKTSGIFDHKIVGQKLFEIFGDTRIEDLKNETWICYTNFDKGEPVYINKGLIVDSLLASMSIPGLFLPVKIDGFNCYDGGLTDNLPVTPLINSGKKQIVGLNCNPRLSKRQKNSIKDILERTFLLIVNGNVLPQTNKCDVYFELEPMADIKPLDFSSARDIYQSGYDYTKQHLEKFKTILPNNNEFRYISK
ncbi:patatin-like phospholipase family protein [Marinigracilibium pacificum]|uniref:PNPLA domain-containing protein n=1 Tax=Marinigracilibium pacificum TaxID=2729599 RepID=A0A848J0X3_9BACT|nr:hypothetical protein [Marinigracilibium pacificum]